MPQQYLLPCPQCNHKLSVSAAQAGNEVVCQCGASMVVPKFGDLRRLEPAPDAPPAAAERNWTRTQGVLFSAGLFVLFIALVLGFFPIRSRMSLPVGRPGPPDMTQVNEIIDDMTPVQTLEHWDEHMTKGVAGPRGGRKPVHIVLRETAEWLDVLIGVAGVAAVGGLISVIASFFVGRK